MADVITVKPEDNPQSQEYIDSMVAKGTAAVNNGNSHAEPAPETVAEIAQKPEGIPDKFYNAETGVVDYASLAKSYTELEKKASGKADKPTTPEGPVTPETPDATTQEEAAKVVEDAGLDFDKLSQEYSEGGAITPESYDKLAKAGIPKEIVDAYIDGRLAAASVARTQAFAVTEGETGYKAMIQWAQANASPEEIATYNKAVNSSNVSARELAVRGLWGRYSADSGNSTGALVTGNTKPVQTGSVYGSRQEMVVAMNDPRYKNDPAYRQTVIDKLAKSDIF